jgi:hypothetical protein
VVFKMSVVVEEITLPGKLLLFADCVNEIEALTSILIIDATLESLYSIFQQCDDRPTKRRKTTKRGARSLTQENGVSTAGVPLGSISKIDNAHSKLPLVPALKQNH